MEGAAHRPERVPEVPHQGVLHRLVGQVDDRRVSGAATGVGDEDVDPAEVLDRAVDDRLAVLTLLDVTGDEVHPIAGVQLGERLLGLLRVAAVDDDLRAFVEEPLGDAEADASRPAGDAGNTPVEYSHVNPHRCLRRAPYNVGTIAAESEPLERSGVGGGDEQVAAQRHLDRGDRSLMSLGVVGHAVGQTDQDDRRRTRS